MAMGSEKLIANELLAFIQHAIDTMDEVSILQICKSGFTQEEISSGKALLYQTLGKTAQMPSRRRDGGERSLQDIVTLLKETDPDDVPAFVAKELHKLPSIGFDHVDVSRLLKDISFLKSSLADVQRKLDASNTTISELRTEILLIKSNNLVCGSPEFNASKANTSLRGAQVASVSSPESALPMTQVTACDTPRPAAAGSPACSAPRPSARSLSVTEPMTQRAPTSRAYATAAAAATSQRATTEKRKSCSGPARKTEPPRLRQDKKCDEEGFVKVERKKKNPSVRNHRGTAPLVVGQLMRGEVPSTQLYVSRVHWSTKVEEVIEYIRKKTTFTLRVERLEPRHKVSFSSFVVRVPTQHLPTFMKEEFWPQGVVFRKFRGRLSHDSRRTSPTLRVK